jgi:lipopolysaccharide export system permease protein
MIGSILSILSVMVVFGLLYKHSEIHPILAAGVPVYRLVCPVMGGMLLVNALIIANQELVMPKIAHRLQASRKEDSADRERVEQVNDYATGIMIGGKWLHIQSRQLEEARFLLPVPQVVGTLTPLKAAQATYFDESDSRPAGWLLVNVLPRFPELKLTPAGQDWVRATDDPKNIFVVSDVSFDQLSTRSRSYRYVTTPELMRRIKNPAFSVVSIRGQMLNLHTRLLRPVADLICILLAVPLIVRKESRSLVTNMGICALMLGSMYALSQASYYLGSAHLIETDLAAWLPIVLCGTLSAWLSGLAQT